MVVTTLLFFVDFVLARDRQHPVLQGYFHIVLLEPSKLGTDHQVVVLGEHVHSRRPLGELLASSLTLPSTSQSPKGLVEEAIDLTLGIVKPTKWTQHGPCTSFSSLVPHNQGPISLLRNHYIPSDTVFKQFHQKIYRFFLGTHSNNRVLIQFIVCYH